MAQPLCIYMDVSVLCRPFDDQSQLRIRLETDAVLLILGQVQSRKITLIVSPAHDAEIGAMDASAEREQVLTLLRTNATRFNFDLSAARTRAEILANHGIGVADAAHLALAEQAKCDFLTCDDRLMRQYKRFSPNVWCGTPVAYCEKENLK